MKSLALALLMCVPAAALAAPTLVLPRQADRTAEEARAMGSYALPIGPWSDGQAETVATEGEVTQTAWRIRGADITTMALIAELRDQLIAEGFDVLFECETDACGGFDFRFSTRVLPEPEMHVDLGDFRFLSARRVAGPVPDYVSLLVSRSADSGFVQMTRVGAAMAKPAALAKPVPASARPPLPTDADGVTTALNNAGKVVLQDLAFDSGSARLSEGDFASLSALAAWLGRNPGRRIALVGHTDAEGSLDANVSLSRQRARSVMERLVSAHGVNPAQLSADGVGYLSPIASNLTPEGRTRNRRVEAMIASTH
ncbi:Peptidoglycan-binding protein ArfA [Defluviimonas aquaemixtae]|uniref:Peptidoglycan-binding protein ArfA n=1 Tax=Albidovulum aquaemixtae TaxID=1542388 RepID=A0A2R8B259_9RHOB|nr:OmpA family protein [Defluviimonas aquaemixtae]SPH16714.1 Peptidoglycan-binding protein ArfA [Defluviimonas aquaemixtae]